MARTNPLEPGLEESAKFGRRGWLMVLFAVVALSLVWAMFAPGDISQQRRGQFLSGGPGNDKLFASKGSDTFHWALGDQGSVSAPARDVVIGFGSVDVIGLADLLPGLLPDWADNVDLARAAAYLRITKLGADLEIAIDVDGGPNFAPQQRIVLTDFAGALAGSTSAAMLQEMIDGKSLVF